GSNFCSKETRRLLIANGIRRSNSRKGNCWDNAVAESFFSSLKRELESNPFYNIAEAEHLLLEITSHWPVLKFKTDFPY
ncbi:integrase core domain-containing protein, partial [Leptospira sp. Pond_2020]|uniref:integrase core domain-containing protein n=1 Tax=Leptospira sp. Pond_2020 TaxID=2846916 RepID=UPI001E52B86D